MTPLSEKNRNFVANLRFKPRDEGKVKYIN